MKEYVDQIDSQKQTLQTLHESANALGKQIETLTVAVAEKTVVDTKIKSFRKIESQIGEKISQVVSDKRFFEHNQDCPTCRQAITVEFKKEQLEGLTNKEQELSTGLKELQDKLKAQEDTLVILENQEDTFYDLRKIGRAHV